MMSKILKYLQKNGMLEVKHQGSTADKSSAQKPNQGVCTDALKPTKEVREGN